MSTPAAIGIRQPDGTVRAIRLNWDGYVAHAGAILGGWYKTAEAVNDLIALGDLSEINESVETCVAYHRDNGEQYRLPRTFASVKDYQYCGMGQMSANYLYIFDDGVLHVYGLDRTSEWIGLEVTKNMEEQ